MPKMKTKKSAMKRFKITAKGKVMRDKTKHRHLLECKTTGKKRKMRKKYQVSGTDMRRIRAMLPGLL